VMRRFLWLATDTAYKSAVEAISRKRAALKNVAVNHPLDDFATVSYTHLDVYKRQARRRRERELPNSSAALLISSILVQAGLK